MEIAWLTGLGATGVYIFGASYGGYAALAGATLTPDLYKCVISIGFNQGMETGR